MCLFLSLMELEQANMQVFKKITTLKHKQMRHAALLFHWIFAVAVDQIPEAFSNLDVWENKRLPRMSDQCDS